MREESSILEGEFSVMIATGGRGVVFALQADHWGAAEPRKSSENLPPEAARLHHRASAVAARDGTVASSRRAAGAESRIVPGGVSRPSVAWGRVGLGTDPEHTAGRAGPETNPLKEI